MAEAVRKRRRMSEQTKRKISESTRGRPKPDGFGEKLSKATKGVSKGPHSPEHRAKIAAAMRGREVSEETRQKNSRGRRGKKHTDESKRRMSESQAKRDYSYLLRGRHYAAKKVRQLTMDGEIVRIWDCMKDIADDPRFPSKWCLRRCCHGTKESYAGYRWEFAEKGPAH